MKILIADSMHSSLFNMLDRQGWTYTYQPDIKRQDIINAIAGYDGLIIRSKTFVDNEVLKAAKN